MRSSRSGIVFVLLAGLTGAVLSLRSPPVLARGGTGLSWGYRPPAGNPFSNLWRQTSFWSQSSGLGLPNRSLGAPTLNAGPNVGGRSNPSRVTGLSHSGGSAQRVGGSSGGSRTTRGSNFQSVARVGGGNSGRTSPAPQSESRSSSGSEMPVYDPPYHNAYNSYWHHGYWGGGLSGWERWGGELGVWGFPRWSIGPVYYASGYGQYQNPFLGEQTGQKSAVTDYSQPIQLAADHSDDPTSTATGAAGPDHPTYEQRLAQVMRTPQVAAGMKRLDAAREAFRDGKFDEALKEVDAALGELPRDPALHEFRALVLFARGDFRESAAAIYAVLSVSPGWNWSTLSSLYADQAEYTRQLRALEEFAKANRDQSAPPFLLAYHYVTCRHVPSAVRQLNRVVKLLPDDELSAQLLGLSGSADEKEIDDAQPDASTASAADAVATPDPHDDSADGPPVEASQLKGRWRAARSTQITIDLTLGEDGRFVWIATDAGKPYRFEGRYAVSDDLLFLAGIGRVMIGHVTLNKPGGFTFELIEPNAADNGLVFGKN